MEWYVDDGKTVVKASEKKKKILLLNKFISFIRDFSYDFLLKQQNNFILVSHSSLI
jgi:hypothetical protein